jgi:integrase
MAWLRIKSNRIKGIYGGHTTKCCKRLQNVSAVGSIDDVTDEGNTNRISIKTAVENYLRDRRFGRPRSIAAYENAFDQLLAHLPRGVRFIDQLATPRALNSYADFLRGQSYSNKTITSRMGFVFSLLKTNGIEKSSKLIKLPKVQHIRTKAYNRDELSKLFAAMTPQEYLRYLFFLRTGCREQEVQFATWRDIDLKNLRYTITGEGKSDVAFVPKNHEERQGSFDDRTRFTTGGS